MASRVKIKVSTASSSAGDGAEERLGVMMRKKISANNRMGGMNRASRRHPLVHDGSDKHLARDPFQCYRFSNLGLIWMLLLLGVLVSLSPVNGELSCLLHC